MNAINFIVPYRYEGMWVFDDPQVGLNKEPFVSGADDIIDVLVSSIPSADKGFRLLFSATPIPGYAVKLECEGKNTAAIGITLAILIWKVGCVLPFSNTSSRRRRKFL